MAGSGKRQRAVVAMSGGVDSSVAAILLARQGYEVVGISMRLWSYERQAAHGCCTPRDLYDARRVADRLGIPHYVNDFEELFEETVVSEFVRAYADGQTPNPCVRCNREVKFHALLKRAVELGGAFLATGHYARVRFDGERHRLFRATDIARDQSYFLFGVGQRELALLRFPLGGLRKEEVRDIARKEGLAVSEKPDSQEICFVPGDYASFVEGKAGPGRLRPGRVLDRSGALVGEHDGVHRFTVGQRKGLRLSGKERRYVLEIAPSGDVVVGPEAALHGTELEVRSLSWVDAPPREGQRLLAQIRSRFSPAPVLIRRIEGDSVAASFETPQRAITPGQAAVFYRGDVVVGGGWIARREGAPPGPH